MLYFGPYVWWNTDPDEKPVLSPTPIGQLCLHCEEPIQEGDLGVIMPHGYLENPEDTKTISWIMRAMHRECHLRQIFGSLAHQKGECSCHGKTNPDDPPAELTRRQEAIQAVEYFMKHNARRPHLHLIK